MASLRESSVFRTILCRLPNQRRLLSVDLRESRGSGFLEGGSRVEEPRCLS